MLSGCWLLRGPGRAGCARPAANLPHCPGGVAGVAPAHFRVLLSAAAAHRQPIPSARSWPSACSELDHLDLDHTHLDPAADCEPRRCVRCSRRRGCPAGRRAEAPHAATHVTWPSRCRPRLSRAYGVLCRAQRRAAAPRRVSSLGPSRVGHHRLVRVRTIGMPPYEGSYSGSMVSE